MSNHDFILKSGAKLHITTANFEEAVALVEAVKQVTLGVDPSLDIDSVVLSNPIVRKTLYACFPWVLYDIHKLSPQLFDDPRIGEQARGDYFEICSKIVDVNCRPFFLMISSKSITTSPAPLESPG